MGYLIGGAGEGPDKEITESSDNPFEKLSDSDFNTVERSDREGCC